MKWIFENLLPWFCLVWFGCWQSVFPWLLVALLSYVTYAGHLSVVAAAIIIPVMMVGFAAIGAVVENSLR